MEDEEEEDVGRKRKEIKLELSSHVGDDVSGVKPELTSSSKTTTTTTSTDSIEAPPPVGVPIVTRSTAKLAEGKGTLEY